MNCLLQQWQIVQCDLNFCLLLMCIVWYDLRTKKLYLQHVFTLILWRYVGTNWERGHKHANYEN